LALCRSTWPPKSAPAARYLHLTLELPAGWRGRELTAGELAHCGARLVEFSVGRIERSP